MEPLDPNELELIAAALGEDWQPNEQLTAIFNRADPVLAYHFNSCSVNLTDLGKWLISGNFKDGSEDLTDYLLQCDKRIAWTPLKTAGSQTPEAIAKKISEKLAPQYERLLATARRKREAYKQMTWESEQFAKGFENSLGLRDATRTGSCVKRTFKGGMKIQINTIGRYDQDPSIMVSLDNLTQAQTEELINWLRKINP